MLNKTQDENNFKRSQERSDELIKRILVLQKAHKYTKQEVIMACGVLAAAIIAADLFSGAAK